MTEISGPLISVSCRTGLRVGETSSADYQFITVVQTSVRTNDPEIIFVTERIDEEDNLDLDAVTNVELIERLLRLVVDNNN